ncbi:MAG: DHH family phosphoesterase, partial [Planctomycetota bacterium]
MPLARTPPATRWHTPPDAEHAADALLPGLHPLVDRLLRARGVEDAEAAERFLTPKLTHLHDPATLPGCVQAAKRLKQAVDGNEPIIIYGDYDVDGVTASAILYHTLKQAGATVQTYVPHRLEEGYGLNAEAITQLADGLNSPPWREGQGRVTNDEGINAELIDQNNSTPSPSPSLQGGGLERPLIVSVDCGITATEPAKIAKDLGVDLIITDHHEFDLDNLPDAYALVHPGLTSHQQPTTSTYENR